MPVLRSHKHRPPAEDFEAFCGEEMKPFVAMQEMGTKPASPESPPAPEPQKENRPAPTPPALTNRPWWRRLAKLFLPPRRSLPGGTA